MTPSVVWEISSLTSAPTPVSQLQAAPLTYSIIPFSSSWSLEHHSHLHCLMPCDHPVRPSALWLASFDLELISHWFPSELGACSFISMCSFKSCGLWSMWTFCVLRLSPYTWLATDKQLCCGLVLLCLCNSHKQSVACEVLGWRGVGNAIWAMKHNDLNTFAILIYVHIEYFSYSDISQHHTFSPKLKMSPSNCAGKKEKYNVPTEFRSINRFSPSCYSLIIGLRHQTGAIIRAIWELGGPI